MIKNSLFRDSILSLVIALCFCNSFEAISQNWQPVGEGFDFEVRCLYTDTVDNLLYCGGSFKSCGPMRARGIATWNGVNWDSLQSGFDDYNISFPNPINAIVRYENKIYVGGSFSTAGGISSQYLARWNGSDWDSLQCFPNTSLIRFKLQNN